MLTGWNILNFLAPTPSPIVRILAAPDTIGVLLVGPIIGIGGHFDLLPVLFSLSLAGHLCTVSLIFDAWIGRQSPPAARTYKGLRHDDPPLRASYSDDHPLFEREWH
jgi:hypothetical protein